MSGYVAVQHSGSDSFSVTILPSQAIPTEDGPMPAEVNPTTFVMGLRGLLALILAAEQAILARYGEDYPRTWVTGLRVPLGGGKFEEVVVPGWHWPDAVAQCRADLGLTPLAMPVGLIQGMVITPEEIEAAGEEKAPDTQPAGVPS